MIKAANNPFGINESGDNLKSLESTTTDTNKIVALVNDSSSVILRDDSKALIRSVSEKNLFPKKDSFLENLPSDWKGFDFSRKKSCILSSTNYQCVTKAINHLESLQITIEKWMKIEDKSGDISSPIRRLVSPQTDESVVNVDGELTNVETGVNLIVVSEEAPVEDLRVGGVLSEVLNLILRLERQRHRANSLLLNERFILNRLKIDIEALALKKVRDLPAKVQIEHDACLADITELNWHISFNQKTESKLQKRCDIAERIHDRLKERVTNIKEMTPQIEEKCNQERELRKRIEKTQKDIDEMLAKTKDRLKDTQERADAANLKAAREREAYEAELNAARWELNKARKRLQEAVEVKNSNQKTYEEWTEKIKSNEKEEKEELKKKNEFKSINEKLKEQLQVLNQERYRVQKELDRARAENEAKQMNIDQLKLGFDTEIGKLTETLNKKTEKLEKILKKKLEKEVNIEEMDKDKKNMESKLEKDQRNRDRLLEEKTRVEDEMRSTEINYDMCVREHKNVLIEHDKELKRLAYKEDVLKRQILELQKQIAEERYSINSIIARMSSENAEYERNKKLLEQRKSQYAVRKRDLDSALVELRKRVANKEKLKADTENQVAKLKADLKDLAERQPREEEELSQKTLAESNRLESSLVRLKTDSDRLEYMKSHMEKMNKNMDEMTTGKENMLKNISKLNNDIQELEVVKTEQTTRCMSSKRLYEQVKTNLDETNYRLVAKTADHTELLEERRNFLEGLLKTLGNTLAINKELASRYRSLKYASFNVKLALIQKFEIKLNRHLSVSDKRQMNALQARMHEALNDFFNFKMRQAEMDYKKLDDTRQNLGETIEKIEENFRESINEVSEFLDEQKSIDYEKMRQQAMQKVHKEELIAAQKQQQQQQQQKQQQNEQQPNSVNLKINKKVYINVN